MLTAKQYPQDRLRPGFFKQRRLFPHHPHSVLTWTPVYNSVLLRVLRNTTQCLGKLILGMHTPCPLSSGNRAGARTRPSHFSQAGCLEEVGLPPAWPRTADQAGGGTSVPSPGSTFYEGTCSARVGMKPRSPGLSTCQMCSCPTQLGLGTVLTGGQWKRQ